IVPVHLTHTRRYVADLHHDAAKLSERRSGGLSLKRRASWLSKLGQAAGWGTAGPRLPKAIRRLEAGDVLVVTRLDRLARSTRDLLNILDAVAKAGAGLKRGVKFGRPTALTPTTP